jgi:hypothetical protein
MRQQGWPREVGDLPSLTSRAQEVCDGQGPDSQPSSVRCRVMLIIALWRADGVAAQTAGGEPSAGGGRPGRSLLVDEENAAVLRDPALRNDLWDSIKFIPFTSSDGNYLSLGGEIREQYERIGHSQWGTVPNDHGYLLQHYMFHADVRVDSSFRLFVQLKSGIEMRRHGGPRPTIDEDRLDLDQAFIDLCAGCGDGSGLSRRSLTVRLGRQEMDLGSSRLVSAREGPNVGPSFDAVRAILQARRWRIDGFVSRPVLAETGVFDDHPDTRRTFWGVYAVHRSDTARSGVDVYYLGLNHKGAQFDQGTADELRHTIGVRIWGTRGRLDYNFEPIWQGGTFGGDVIRAWTVASDTGWQLSDTGHLRLGCRADVTSGDRNRTDGTLGTFNPLFPTGAYFSRVDPVGPYNHMDLHPEIDLRVAPAWLVTASWLWLWRTELDDGLYSILGQLLRSGRGTSARFIGQAPSLEIQRQIDRHLVMNAGVALVTAGAFIRETGPAHSTVYTTALATYKF